MKLRFGREGGIFPNIVGVLRALLGGVWCYLYENEEGEQEKRME